MERYLRTGAYFFGALTRMLAALAAVVGCSGTIAAAAEARHISIELPQGFYAGGSVTKPPEPGPMVAEARTNASGTLGWSGPLGRFTADFGATYALSYAAEEMRSTIKPYAQLSRDMHISGNFTVMPFIRFDITQPLERGKTRYDVHTGSSATWRVTPSLTVTQRLDAFVHDRKLTRGMYRSGLEWRLATITLTIPSITVSRPFGVPEPVPHVALQGRLRMGF